MEHRRELEELLLSGLPEAERRQVIRAIAKSDAALLRHKAAMPQASAIDTRASKEAEASLR